MVRGRQPRGHLLSSADPNDVAVAIYDAVNDPQPRLRYLVGADANMIGAVRKQTDFEGFEKAMRDDDKLAGVTSGTAMLSHKEGSHGIG